MKSKLGKNLSKSVFTANIPTDIPKIFKSTIRKKMTAVFLAVCTAGSMSGVAVNAVAAEQTINLSAYATSSSSQTQLSNTSTISANAIKLGNTITLTAKATGGTAPYKYSYYCKLETAADYTTLRSNTNDTTYTHKPARTIKYTYDVEVTDSTGNTVRKSFNVSVTDQTPSLPEPDRQGSIIIHKYQIDQKDKSKYTGIVGTGLKSDEANVPTTIAKPLANVTFTLFKVGSVSDTEAKYNLDLLVQNTTTGKWSYNNVSESDSVTTNADGIAKFSSLSLARYLVVETASPNSVVEKTEPFFIDVPTTDVTDYSSLLYDIHVYPKNFVGYDIPDIEKDVTEIGNDHDTANLNEKATWIIYSKNPKTIRDYNKYIITDTLDKRLAYVPNSLKVKRGTSYNKATTVDPSRYENVTPTTSTGGKLSIKFKPNYLKTLTVSDKTTYYFYITFETTLKSVEFDTNGNTVAIPNGAIIEYDYTNKPDEDTGKDEVPDDHKPEIHTGGFRFTKVNEQQAPLSGAEFKIATSEENAKNNKFIKDTDGNDIVYISDANGAVNCIGLKYGEKGNNHEQGTADYWIIETKAPQGCELLKEAKRFTVSHTSYADTKDFKIVNNSSPDYPLTGSSTAILFTVIGITTSSFGVILLLKPKKKSKK